MDVIRQSMSYLRNLISDTRLYRAVYVSMCVIVFMCHLISLSQQFFSYPVRVNVKLQTPLFMELPAISICVDAIDSFDIGKLAELQPKLLAKLNRNDISNITGTSFRLIPKWKGLITNL